LKRSPTRQSCAEQNQNAWVGESWEEGLGGGGGGGGPKPKWGGPRSRKTETWGGNQWRMAILQARPQKKEWGEDRENGGVTQPGNSKRPQGNATQPKKKGMAVTGEKGGQSLKGKNLATLIPMFHRGKTKKNIAATGVTKKGEIKKRKSREILPRGNSS